MTNIQAINLLKDLEQSLDDYCELNDEGKTAFRMAITALKLFGISEQLPSSHPDLSSYSDKLWRSAYERGKAEAQAEIIRCKDCKWWGYDDDTGAVRVCHAAKHGHISSHWDIHIFRRYRGDFYCADAERRTDGTEQP